MISNTGYWKAKKQCLQISEEKGFKCLLLCQVILLIKYEGNMKHLQTGKNSEIWLPMRSAWDNYLWSFSSQEKRNRSKQAIWNQKSAATEPNSGNRKIIKNNWELKSSPFRSQVLLTGFWVFFVHESNHIIGFLAWNYIVDWFSIFRINLYWVNYD